MLIGTQCTAARALLRWTQGDLADAIVKSGGKLSVTAITAFERGGAIRDSNAKLIRLALEANDIQFLENGETALGDGVVLRRLED